MLTESISKLHHNHSFGALLIQNNMPRVHKIKLSGNAHAVLRLPLFSFFFLFSICGFEAKQQNMF